MENRPLKEKIGQAVAGLQERLAELSDWLYEHPELGGLEHLAVQRLTEELKAEGFAVETGLAGLPTAFKATFSLGAPGPVVGFLAEYDALPGIGHGCGHNIIAASCLGSAIALARVLNGTAGTVVVFGTPAEETTGGKIQMTEAGVFNGLDAVMSVHPANRTSVGGSSLASHPLEISFRGRAAHAAAAPQEGINALDALLQTFAAMKALKHHLRDDVRMPGIITQGGAAPNIVPDFAAARFSLRAADREYLELVIGKVKNCARGAALATGAEVSFNHYEPLFDALWNNPVLQEAFRVNLTELGYTVQILPPQERGGSTDVGNVSQVVPTIHPDIAIGPADLQSHTREFAAATRTAAGRRGLYDAAHAMALTAVDVFTRPELRARIKEEFHHRGKI
jgi:amidohydrolase